MITAVQRPHFKPLEIKTDEKWHALYTKGRHEKFIQGELAKKGIEAFLPLKPIKRRWSDRTVTIEEPVFSSYVFVCVRPQRYWDVLSTKGSVKFVSVGPSPVPIAAGVMESLRKAFAVPEAVEAFPYLHQGQKVYVRSGVFKGVEGIIARKDDRRCRVVVSIDAIMSSISVEVDSCLVEKI